MNVRGIIAVSLGLNVVLAWLLFTGRADRPAATATDSDASRAARASRVFVTNAPRIHLINQRIPFQWSELESEDFLEYIARLKSIGCPEQTIRDIIVAEVTQLYDAKRRAVRPDDVEWWKADVRQQAARSVLRKQQDLDQERDALLDELLGTGWRAQRTADQQGTSVSALTGPVLGNLSEETKAAVEALLQRRGQEISEAIREMDGPVNALQMGRLQQQTREELAKLLTPDQLEEYLLRWSDSAGRLRDELKGLDLTPEQFRELFRKVDAAEQQALAALAKLPEDADGSGFAESLAALRSGKIEELAASVGIDAGELRLVQLNRDPNFASLSDAAREAGLAPELVLPMHEIGVAARAEAERIKNDPNLTEAQREEALMQAALDTSRALRQVAGEERWGKMRDSIRSDFYW